MFSQKLTNEALIQALQQAEKEDGCAGFIISSELAVFLGGDSGRSGIISTLTDLYDSPPLWSYHTRGRGQETLKNVTMSMLAATTQTDVSNCLPSGAVGGGFTSRIIFVYQESTDRAILFGEEDKDGYELVESLEERRLHAYLLHDLEVIRKIKGPMKFMRDAKQHAEEWYKEEKKKPHDAVLDGYYGRKHDTMFKVAALLSLGRSDALLIERRDIRRALSMLGDMEFNLTGVLASVVATAVGSDIEKILTIVKKSEGIAHSELLSKTWRIGKSTEINEMIRTLVEGHEIQEYMEGRIKYYRVKRGDGYESTTNSPKL